MNIPWSDPRWSRRLGRSLVALILTLSAASGCGSSNGAAPARSGRAEAVRPAELPCRCEWLHAPMLILFPPRSSEIVSRNDDVLEELAATVNERVGLVAIRVEGHSATCPEEFRDRALSEERAAAVAARLEELGVDPGLLSTVGYGSTMPRKGAKERQAPCGPDEEEARVLEAERRVEFSVRVCTREIRGELVACNPTRE